MNTQSKWIWGVGILIVGTALLAFGVAIQNMLLLFGLLLLCPLMMCVIGGKNMHGGSHKDEEAALSDAPRHERNSQSK